MNLRLKKYDTILLKSYSAVVMKGKTKLYHYWNKVLTYVYLAIDIALCLGILQIEFTTSIHTITVWIQILFISVSRGSIDGIRVNKDIGYGDVRRGGGGSY